MTILLASPAGSPSLEEEEGGGLLLLLCVRLAESVRSA